MSDVASPEGSAPTAAPLLEVRGLRKDFDLARGWFRAPRLLRAVDGVSFSVAPGETLGIVGESGSGKSTVGRMVLRLIEPSAGTIRFDGTNVLAATGSELRSLRRGMQMIFQDPAGALNPHFTVFDAVAEPFRIHGIPRNPQDERDRVGALLRRVGLAEELVARYPKALSGGQRQRVVIARALALEPKLVFCDEPVSALDVSVQAQVLNLLCDLQDELGLTYLFVAHDLSVVRLVSHRVAVMSAGRIVESGLAREVYEDPLHPYTKMLLASVHEVRPDAAPTKKVTRLAVVGDAASPRADSLGCAFSARCVEAEKGLCDRRTPESRQVKVRGSARSVACHRL